MQEPEWLIALRDTAAEILPQHYTVTRCLNATRVILEVAKGLRLPARPLVVETIAMNAPFVELMVTHQRMPQSAEERERWYAETGAHAVGVGLGGDPEEGRWPGHIVAIVKGWLVDASASQMNRPQHKMRVPEVVVVDAPERFQSGHLSLNHLLDDGTLLNYNARPENISYRTLEGFQRSEVNIEVARIILSSLRSSV
jgi:hypothetical protein